MKKLLLAVSIGICLVEGLGAQQDARQNIRFRTAFAYEQLTIDATAGGIALTAATYNPTVTDTPGALTRAELAVINCQTAPIRYRVDGVAAPTAALGTIQNAGDTVAVYSFANIQKWRGFRTTGVSAVCDATYYRNLQ